MIELTSNPDREELETVEVMGRTVYVSQSSEKAYVEFQDELVSLSDLRAWNHLIEKAKQKAIDGYNKEKTVQEKELERTRQIIGNEIWEMGHELEMLSQRVKDE